jgi:hypothetical protein
VPQPLDQSIRLIPLTKNQNAIVDADDYEWLNQFNWCAYHTRNKWYAVRRQAKMTIPMHREILNNCQGEIDHKDGNGLNNTKSNLRICTHAQNQANQRLQRGRIFKGICYTPITRCGKYVGRRTKPWLAVIKLNQKQKHLGYFATQEEAARAYDKAAKELFGEFARTNFES